MNNKTIIEFAYRMMGKSMYISEDFIHLGLQYNSSHPTQPHSIIANYTCSVILKSIGKKFTADRISVALETGSRSRPFLESLSYLCFLRKARLNYENICLVMNAGQGNTFIKAEFPYLIHLFDCFFFSVWFSGDQILSLYLKLNGDGNKPFGNIKRPEKVSW